MAEVGIIPRLSKVLRRKELLRLLRRAKMTIYICPCGQWYRHLWREARVLILEQRRALWRYLDRVYARATEAKRSQVDEHGSRKEHEVCPACPTLYALVSMEGASHSGWGNAKRQKFGA